MITFGITTQGISGVEYVMPGMFPASLNPISISVPERETISSIAVRQNIPGTGAGNILYRLFIDGSPSGIEVTLAATDTFGFFSGDDVSFDENQAISLVCEKLSGIGVSPSNVVITLGNG